MGFGAKPVYSGQFTVSSPMLWAVNRKR